MPDSQKTTFLTLTLAIYLACSLIAMAPMSIAGVLLLSASLFTFKGTIKPVLSSSEIKTYSVFIGAIFLISFFSLISAWVSPIQIENQTLPFTPFQDLAGLMKFWHFLVPISIAGVWLKISDKQRNTALQTYFIFFALISIVGLQEHFTGWPFSRSIASEPGRFHTQAFLKFHLSYASVFCFPFFLLYGFLKAKSKLLPFFIAVWVTAGFALFFTYSRSLWVALPVGILFVLLSEIRRRKIKIFAVTGIVSLMIATSQLPAIQNRIYENGLLTRIELWNVHFQLFLKSPLFGVGFRKNTDFVALYNNYFPSNSYNFIISHAHSNWIEILCGTGLLGIVAWLGLWIWIFKKTLLLRIKINSLTISKTAFLATWVVFHINGLTQVNFLEGKVAHSLSIAIGLLLGESLRNKKHE